MGTSARAAQLTASILSSGTAPRDRLPGGERRTCAAALLRACATLLFLLAATVPAQTPRRSTLARQQDWPLANSLRVTF